MSVAFGTSGLRGPASGFSPDVCRAYVGAFLERTAGQTTERIVYIGGDLRQSTESIASLCMGASVAFGWQPVWAGGVPTPALAAYAMARGCPAIMVTGSHIPESYNGIKFYRPDGEFLKEDEAPVAARAGALLADGVTLAGAGPGAADPAIARAYVARYADAFGGAALSGLRIGVDLHSAVGRDLIVEILTAIGADVTPFRRSDHFIAVDTEALNPDDVARSAAMIAEHDLACVVSTDGDGDRPLVIDETGSQINGDVLGALTACALHMAMVVTPLSSTSAIEQSGWFAHVERTKIGSPFVVAAMARGRQHPVCGFEANGGFLLGDDLALAHGRLTALPTRDAMLPIIGVLMAAKTAGISLSALAGGLPARFMKADRIKEVAPETGRALLAGIQTDRAVRVAIDLRLADPVEINTLDGVRMAFADGSTIHFRQSGNAPELRIYVETGDRGQTAQWLADLLDTTKAKLSKG